jgi:hypothetical protein
MYPGYGGADTSGRASERGRGQGELRWPFRSGSAEAAGAVRDFFAPTPVLVVERRSFIRTVARRVVGSPHSRPACLGPSGRPHSIDRPAVPCLSGLPGIDS